jgi:two-component system, chemotaxis family, protein-glutamate methylesterase/glutaminase
MIKVLIVEDSRLKQEFLAYVLKSDPVIDVVGIVDDGINALQAVKEKHPDVITMDIHMPQMGGFEATRLIMANEPRPIVIVSASTGAKDVASTFQALEAGALAVVLTPPGIGHPDHYAAARELVRTVKMMSEIKVVRRFSHTVKPLPPVKTVVPNLKEAGEFQLIAIGTSTGGPPVLNKLLSLLPADLSVPLLIVQHIAPGFIVGFVDWLSSASGFPMHIAENNQKPLPGHGYVAPEDFHIGIASGLRIVLSNHAPENGLRPSAAYLFRTVAQVLGPRAIGVLLTGMGKDGARELLEMKNAGALTIAQDEASSIVFGMPGEAVKLGAAEYILPPEAIAEMLVSLAKKATREPG